MLKEREAADEDALERLKQSVFASAFGSVDPRHALGQYHKVFEEPTEDEEVVEYIPENKQDVLEMLNEARRAGAIQ